mmetsp:Transcript_98762/g.235409  ORF Transcript_98762/g.235409 Transcript_98762/m.235409 type:complete len:318 (+) Transcript_98762:123-1076(+)
MHLVRRAEGLDEAGVGVGVAMLGKVPPRPLQHLQHLAEAVGVPQADTNLQDDIHQDLVHLAAVPGDQVHRAIKVKVLPGLVALEKDAHGVRVHARTMTLHLVDCPPSEVQVALGHCGTQQDVEAGSVGPKPRARHLLHQVLGLLEATFASDQGPEHDVARAHIPTVVALHLLEGTHRQLQAARRHRGLQQPVAALALGQFSAPELLQQLLSQLLVLALAKQVGQALRAVPFGRSPEAARRQGEITRRQCTGQDAAPKLLRGGICLLKDLAGAHWALRAENLQAVQRYQRPLSQGPAEDKLERRELGTRQQLAQGFLC